MPSRTAIFIRVSPVTLERIRRAAAAEKRTVSAYARNVIEAELERLDPTPPAWQEPVVE